MGELVPIAGIAMIVALVLGPIWLGLRYKAREKAGLHRTVQMALERGEPLPPELIEALRRDQPRPTPESDLRNGVILTAVALAMMVLGGALAWADGDTEILAVLSGASAFPGFIGLGYLGFWLSKRAKT